MSLLDRLRHRLNGHTVDTAERERQVRQIAQDTEAALRAAQEALSKPSVLIELRRLETRRQNDRPS